MTPSLTDNTKAILLLTAPLIVGKAATTFELLTLREYNHLARYLREINCQPSDLINANSNEVLCNCQHVIEENRMRGLLGRGFLLTQAIERWQSRSIWVISRADECYPRRIKVRLREEAPPVIYGCGDLHLLDKGGLAVVGSRNINDQLIEYTIGIGAFAAQTGISIVSGGAKGADQAAMQGALDSGGYSCGVLADRLENKVMSRENRNMLLNKSLVLISPFDPNAGFNVGHAMQRNKVIYALADASLVVNSDINKGGTWTGAVEQIEKYKFIPVYIRSTGPQSPGLDELEKKGAILWPNPEDEKSFEQLILTAIERKRNAHSEQTSLSNEDSRCDYSFCTSAPQTNTISPSSYSGPEHVADKTSMGCYDVPVDNEINSSIPKQDPANSLFAFASEIMQHLLVTPKTPSEIASALEVTNTQVQHWLQRLVDDGVLEKKNKPVRYVLREKENLFSKQQTLL